MRYTWITEKFLPIGEKLGQKGISAARAESISAARFLPGGEKRANTDPGDPVQRRCYKIKNPVDNFSYGCRCIQKVVKIVCRRFTLLTVSNVFWYCVIAQVQ